MYDAYFPSNNVVYMVYKLTQLFAAKSYFMK
jgi:hypothetical protein